MPTEQVTLTTPWGNHKRGATVMVDGGRAKKMVDMGVAVRGRRTLEDKPDDTLPSADRQYRCGRRQANGT